MLFSSTDKLVTRMYPGYGTELKPVGAGHARETFNRGQGRSYRAVPADSKKPQITAAFRDDPSTTQRSRNASLRARIIGLSR
jgi:hypothetical protein